MITMRCFHPYCPAGAGLPSWDDVVNHPELAARPAERAMLLAALKADYARPPSNPAICSTPPATGALLKRLLRLCPCLFNQTNETVSPRGVVHLCELTLGAPITSNNVEQAFDVQYPGRGPFLFPPARSGAAGGTVMEFLCSEVLASAGIPPMELRFQPKTERGWPEWKMPGHVLLNEGGMGSLRAFGDILVPCAPVNLVISVKSEVARERLLYSSNSIEGVGFGFFKQPDEFWTASRMNLYKRMGFTAIYMPAATLASIDAHLAAEGNAAHAVNVNGTPLYRSLNKFGDDMRRIVGKSSLLL